MRYYSPSTGGFYSEAVHGARQIAAKQTEREIKAGKRPRMITNPECRIPEDAVKITAERHAELLAAQASGKAIVASAGKPFATTPVPDPAELAATRRKLRDRKLAESDWTQLADTLNDQPELKLAWAIYRQQLRDLDMAGSEWPAAPIEGLSDGAA